MVGMHLENERIAPKCGFQFASPVDPKNKFTEVSFHWRSVLRATFICFEKSQHTM